MNKNLCSVLFLFALFSIAHSTSLKHHKLVMSSKAIPQVHNFQDYSFDIAGDAAAHQQGNQTQYTDQAVDYPQYDNQTYNQQQNY